MGVLIIFLNFPVLGTQGETTLPRSRQFLKIISCLHEHLYKTNQMFQPTLHHHLLYLQLIQQASIVSAPEQSRTKFQAARGHPSSSQPPGITQTSYPQTSLPCCPSYRQRLQPKVPSFFTDSWANLGLQCNVTFLLLPGDRSHGFFHGITLSAP